MATSKAFIILIICIFQVYAQTETVDVKKEFAHLLKDYLVALNPIRQSYIDSVTNGDRTPDSGLKYFQYVKNIGPKARVLIVQIDDLIAKIEANNPGYENDIVDAALVNFFKETSEVSKTFDSDIVEKYSVTDFKVFILTILDDIEKTDPPKNEDFANPTLKYFNDKQAMFVQFGKDFKETEGLEEDERIERFEEIMAVVQVNLNQLDADFIQLVESGVL